MIKWLSALLVAVAFTATISCLKKQNLEETDGPTVSAAEMQKNLGDAWINDDPHNMKKDEFTSVLSVQTLQDVQTRFLGQEGFTILDKSLSPDHTAYNMRMAIQTAEYLSDGQTKLSTEEMPFTVGIPEGGQAQSLALPDRIKSLASNPGDRIFVTRMFYFLMTICEPRETIQLSCHNLQVSEGVMDAPDDVIREGLCKVGTDCKIKYKQIDFDLVIKDPQNGSKKDKYKLQAKISHDVPYLARVLSYCQRGLSELSGSQQKVTVNLCQNVNKYQFGSP